MSGAAQSAAAQARAAVGAMAAAKAATVVAEAMPATAAAAVAATLGTAKTARAAAAETMAATGTSVAGTARAGGEEQACAMASTVVAAPVHPSMKRVDSWAAVMAVVTAEALGVARHPCFAEQRLLADRYRPLPCREQFWLR